MEKESKLSKPADSFSSPLVIGGFNLIALLVFFLAFAGGQSGKDDVVLLTTGEWSPYTGKDLPQQGIASAIVMSILENMGLPARVQFLPWQQSLQLAAQAESDSDVRASFPYSRTPEREKDFYYSLPILSVTHGIYFNPEKFGEGGISPVKLRWDLTEPPNLSLFERDLVASALQSTGLPGQLTSLYLESHPGAICEPGDGAAQGMNAQAIEQLHIANEKALLAMEEWLRTSQPVAHSVSGLIEDACRSIQLASSSFMEAYQRMTTALGDIRSNSSLPPGKIDELRIAYTRQLNDIVKTYLILRLHHIAIIRISGYQYPQPLNTLLEASGQQVEDIRAAFAHLLSSDRRLVILEARRVAERQLQDNFPFWFHKCDESDPEFGTDVPFREELAFYRGDASLHDNDKPAENYVATRLTSMAFSFDIPEYLLAGRRNPDNRHFIQDFNRHLILLYENGTLEKVAKHIEQELQEDNVVELYPFSGAGYVRGYTSASGGDYVVLVPGTRAVVIEWSEAHLKLQTAPQLPVQRVAVKLRQGPGAGTTYFIDSRSIQFP